MFKIENMFGNVTDEQQIKKPRCGQTSSDDEGLPEDDFFDIEADGNLMIFTKPKDKYMLELEDMTKDETDFQSFDPTEDEVSHLLQSIGTKVTENSELVKAQYGKENEELIISKSIEDFCRELRMSRDTFNDDEL